MGLNANTDCVGIVLVRRVKESPCNTQTKLCDSQMWVLKYPFEYPYFNIYLLFIKRLLTPVHICKEIVAFKFHIFRSQQKSATMATAPSLYESGMSWTSKLR